MKTLEYEAQYYSMLNIGEELSIEDKMKMVITKKLAFIDGARSKWVQAEKIKSQIESLREMSERLSTKMKTLSIMIEDEGGSMRGSMLTKKRSGVGLAKEEIRVEIMQLEHKLKELEDEEN